MKKIKVADAPPKVIDWLVARCEARSAGVDIGLSQFLSMYEIGAFCYSTNWFHGGPIIEREGIQWAKLNGGIEAWSGWDFLSWLTDWDGDHRMPAGAGFGRHETSILVAAMRCYVERELGDEVEVPEELL